MMMQKDLAGKGRLFAVGLEYFVEFGAQCGGYFFRAGLGYIFPLDRIVEGIEGYAGLAAKSCLCAVTGKDRCFQVYGGNIFRVLADAFFGQIIIKFHKMRRGDLAQLQVTQSREDAAQILSVSLQRFFFEVLLSIFRPPCFHEFFQCDGGVDIQPVCAVFFEKNCLPLDFLFDLAGGHAFFRRIGHGTLDLCAVAAVAFGYSDQIGYLSVFIGFFTI